MQTATRRDDYLTLRCGLRSGASDGEDAVMREKAVLVCVFAAGVTNALHGCGQQGQEQDAGSDVGASATRDAGRAGVAVIADAARGPRRVHVRLRATPDDAELWLDGERVPNPYDEEWEASEEAHRVEARRAGYRPDFVEGVGFEFSRVVELAVVERETLMVRQSAGGRSTPASGSADASLTEMLARRDASVPQAAAAPVPATTPDAGPPRPTTAQPTTEPAGTPGRRPLPIQSPFEESLEP